MSASPDLERVVLGDDRARLEIVPTLGAGIARYDLMRGDERVPLFRPAPEVLDPDAPFELGMNLLLPWSNRISGGGFETDGVFHPLEPNLDGEPYPIHGNAFQRPWEVVRRSATAAALALRSEGPGPFRYDARVEYELDAGALRVVLDVVNRAPARLPYGGGLHPWFPRDETTRLRLPAAGVWLEDERYLPTEHVPVTDREGWDFRTARALPNGWINNAFTGWDGAARLDWPARGLALDIEADASLGTCVVHSPGPGSGFVCVEPVSHAVDAHRLGPGGAGCALRPLDPGQGWTSRCRFVPGTAAPDHHRPPRERERFAPRGGPSSGVRQLRATPPRAPSGSRTTSPCR